MATSQSTGELISKHRVLTGFSRFMYFALAAIAINIANSLYGPYKDYLSVYILSDAALIIVLSLLLYKKNYTLAAKIITAITFNVVFLGITMHIGHRGATYLYYFPFILAYIYLFRTEGNYKHVLVFSIISIGCLVLSLILSPDDSPAYKVPDLKMKEIFLLTFLISFSLTVYFFILIYNYQQTLYKRILDLEKNNRLQQLRSVIETQESGIQGIVEELRNNINQTLAASKFFLEKYMEADNDRALVSKSHEMTSEAINALTMLCIKLHPAVITDIGFIDGIKEFITELKKMSKVEIHFEYKGSGIEKIDNNDKISIFRIIQDYLILVLKNIPTSRVNIEVGYQSPVLILTLSQNDPAFNFMKAGHVFNLNDINNRITYYKGTISQKQEGQFETSVVEFSLS